MFGIARRRATSAAVDALRPLIGTIQHTYGTAPHFWSDPYIVGFFYFMIGHRAKLATQGKITGIELGTALADTFTALSNMNGVAISRRAVELLNANDPDFNRAADDAAAICYYELGNLKDAASHPLVIKAGRLAGNSHERANVLPMMIMASLMHEVDTRLRGAD
ncbi:MAG: hypothetical protein JWN71_4182 [Xanthobacteraceae bacterium]|nr:hypothetical protein [Xanthobacteraceae bacterium]